VSRPRFLADHNFNRDIVEGLTRREPAIEIVLASEVEMHGANAPLVLSGNEYLLAGYGRIRGRGRGPRALPRELTQSWLPGGFGDRNPACHCELSSRVRTTTRKLMPDSWSAGSTEWRIAALQPAASKSQAPPRPTRSRESPRF
jgi:hypothetical protein